MKQQHQNKSAIVIGASMAGLMTARVLSDHFDTVYLVERDQINDCPETRKGQPHTQHLHTLLGKGLFNMQHYFPDFLDSLKKGGASVFDLTKYMAWNTYGNYRMQFEQGFEGVLASRPFLEWKVRQSVLKLGNLKLLSGHSVDRLLTNKQKNVITGVQMNRRHGKDNPIMLNADLVVDTSGRGSRAIKWLAELGYQKPVTSKVSCGIGYATRMYHRKPDEHHASKWFLTTPEAPKEQRGGGAFPIEGNRWQVTLAGWHGDHAPDNETGFLAFAKSLPTSDIYQLISQNEPVSDICLYKYSYSQRHHYDQLTDHHKRAFPQGFLVLGDAVCSFNPIYGQGMTSAILQAVELDNLLTERQGYLKDIAKPYFKRVAKVTDPIWQLTVGEDFRFPQTVGRKLPGTDFINAYLNLVHRATHADLEVSKTFAMVFQLVEKPICLFKPNIIARVLWHKFKTPAPKASPQRQLSKA